MDMNGIILITSLCFAIGLVIHISVERHKDKRQREEELKQKRKRVRETLKRLDWQRKK